LGLVELWEHKVAELWELPVLSLIPKDNATVSIGSVLKMRARSHCQ
jgi:hypothetical protein